MGRRRKDRPDPVARRDFASFRYDRWRNTPLPTSRCVASAVEYGTLFFPAWCKPADAIVRNP